MEIQSAIEQALNTVRRNVDLYAGTEKFPHVSRGDGKYHLTDSTDWTEGFWAGMLWLGYEYGGDSKLHEAAVRATDLLERRLDANQALDHHDIGFLYSLSAQARWTVDGSEEARRVALRAADALMRRWRPSLGIFQAWGPEGDPENGGRMIIDCLMNLPLLCWATRQTGDERYAECARIHAEKSLRFLVRGDDSSYHTFYFDQQTGDALRGGTHQGYRDGSTWTRGQAWGVYGFALAYRNFGDPRFLEASERMARHFAERLPEDGVAYWDFDAPQQPGTPRDSSASAIFACGVFELLSLLPDSYPARDSLEQSARSAVRSLLADDYFTAGADNEEGLLRHGSYSVRGGSSPDDFMIWGDYFFLEALMRLHQGTPGYWYER
ncbi:glucuronyl hydrolase [Saccharibacillus sp. O23]|uniref:glycoside hydrolase family 88 protein n=1 Tax=Saccharibacillus sp. O23 TaxID=2009338 RepID=UPI000B4E3AFC|nr:glycoside hydrolase family 88 protein [Saccharibacillus sp. O23]OWR28734.1 glucuronyl hydrolase [Saccharibacillus sp. O23]